MKVLILSCIMGEGHNSAANAIAEFLNRENIECEVFDTLTLSGKDASRKASNTYIHAISFPFLFRITYYAGKLISSPKRKSPVYYSNRKYRDKLYAYITEHGFDTVITTHLFPAEALTALKREGRLNAITLGVITDYTCCPFWEETELDYYVIPHEDLRKEFLKHGLPSDKLLPFGIPVKEAFLSKLSKPQAREEFNSSYHLRLITDKPWYMVMSGSMGFGKIGILVSAIIKLQKADVNIIIVCGNNEKLFKRLSFLFKNHANIAVLGFINDVPLLMDACDVLFTKPGGLSSTEAAVKNIPIVHTAPIPGNETNNAAFFSEHGMSYSSPRIRKQLFGARMLCSDSAYRSYIINSQLENINNDSCRLIYEKLCNIKSKEGEAGC